MLQSQTSQASLTFDDMAQTGWNLVSTAQEYYELAQIKQADSSKEIQQLFAQIKSEAEELAVSNSRSQEESSWMSIIDLVKSCELQLDPVPSLQKKFDKATDTFFGDLESQEKDYSSKEKQQAAYELRNSIRHYKDSCEKFIVEYQEQMKQRKSMENNAFLSIKVHGQKNNDQKDKESGNTDDTEMSQVASVNLQKLYDFSISSDNTMLAQTNSADYDDEDTYHDNIEEQGNPYDKQIEDQADTANESDNDDADQELGDSDKEELVQVSENEDQSGKLQEPNEEQEAEESPQQQDEDQKSGNDESQNQDLEQTGVEMDKNEKVDGSQPLGRLSLEIGLLLELSDDDLVSVAYEGSL